MLIEFAIVIFIMIFSVQVYIVVKIELIHVRSLTYHAGHLIVIHLTHPVVSPALKLYHYNLKNFHVFFRISVNTMYSSSP